MVESTGKRRNYLFLQFYLKLLDVWAFWLSMPHNGPAVEGVNVGGAVRRYESWYFSRIRQLAESRRASHHGAIFASPGKR
jgi:hypothetical protein